MKTRSCGQEVTVLQVLYFRIRASRFILLGAMPAQQLLPLGGVRIGDLRHVKSRRQSAKGGAV